MAVMILTKVYMETVVVNNTKYDVLVEEEARLVRFSFSDKHGDDDCDNANYDDYYGDNGANFVTASADDNDDIDEDDDNNDDDINQNDCSPDWRSPIGNLATSAISGNSGLSWCAITIILTNSHNNSNMVLTHFDHSPPPSGWTRSTSSCTFCAPTSPSTGSSPPPSSSPSTSSHSSKSSISKRCYILTIIIIVVIVIIYVIP